MKSLRKQLLLSYFTVTLISTLGIGLIFIIPLQRYFVDLEVSYLQSEANAEMLASLGGMLNSEAPSSVISSQLEIVGLVHQVRIQLLDQDRRIVGDSGQFADLLEKCKHVLTLAQSPDGSWSAEPDSLAGNNNLFSFLVLDRYEDPQNRTPQDSILIPGYLVGAANSVELSPGTQSQAVQYFGPVSESLDLERAKNRSSFQHEIAFVSERGELLGSVIFSEGPSFGKQLMGRVIKGWIMASLGGILIALGVGFLKAREINGPVDQLVAASEQIGKGNLNVRIPAQPIRDFGRVAQAFNLMTRSLKEQLSTMQNFLTNAAHGIRTPTTALLSNLELLLDNTPVNANQAELLRLSMRQAQRLDRISISLLSLFKIGNQKVADHLVNLSDLIRASKEYFASYAEQKNVQFEIAMRADPVWLRGIPDELDMLFRNIIDNAIKFSNPGGTVFCELENNPHEVKFVCQDSGIGIPRDEVDQIGEPFRRGRNVSEIPGNGLGMSIVKSVVEKYQGVLVIRSSQKGTIIRIYLPKAPAFG